MTGAPTTPTTARGRALAAPVALVVASTAAALVALEVGLRVAGHLQGLDYRLYLQEMTTAGVPAHIWARDGGDGARAWQAFQRYPPLRPGAAEVMAKADFTVTYRINTRGLRDREHPYERVPGLRRVVALGDSFTFGSGVAYGERFADVAEDLLGDVEVVDMGVPGYGLDQALLAFVVEGVRYRPDAVVVFVNRHVLQRRNADIVKDGRVELPHDLTSLSALAAEPQGPTTAYLRPDDPLLRSSPAVVRASFLLSYATYRIRLWRLRARLAEEAERGPQAPLTGSFTLVAADSAVQARSTALLRALRERAAAAGVGRVVVVNIDDAHRFPFLARLRGIAYHDLADELVALNARVPIRFRFDPHYTAPTHRFIGERVAALLRDDLAGPVVAAAP